MINLPADEQAEMMKTFAASAAEVAKAKPAIEAAYKIVTDAAARTRRGAAPARCAPCYRVVVTANQTAMAASTTARTLQIVRRRLGSDSTSPSRLANRTMSR